MPPPALEALKEHRRRQQEERLKAGPSYRQNNLVFANPLGAPSCDGKIVRYHYRPILKRVGIIKHLRLYDLRHSFATLSLLAGVHPKVVSEALGHTSVAFTMDTYAHVLPTMQEDAAVMIEALLYATPTEPEEGSGWLNSAAFAHISHTSEDEKPVGLSINR